MSSLKACVRCGYLVDKDTEICPACHSDEFTEEWKGIAVVIDVNSKVAERLGASLPGKYALRILEE
ncbi:MAG: DNA-directed RNA polymerase, subunit E'' [Methanopyri archaeon]|nr:DNA-directed RNA polymerase, subunit E'' [Methanopyri archaeon]